MLCLLFGKGSAVARYCSISRLLAIIICKVLFLPTGTNIDGFAYLFWLDDSLPPPDL